MGRDQNKDVREVLTLTFDLDTPVCSEGPETEVDHIKAESEKNPSRIGLIENSILSKK